MLNEERTNGFFQRIKGLAGKGLITEDNGVFAPAFEALGGGAEDEAFEPVVIRTRRARSSGVLVQFWKMAPHSYKCVCEHGTERVGTERYETARAAANPDLWCPECAKLAEERTEAKAAKKAERAKAKAERVKASKKTAKKAEAKA